MSSPNPTPIDNRITGTIQEARQITGMSRSGIYRAKKEGRIVFRKLGRTTLVDFASLRAYIASLPTA